MICPTCNQTIQETEPERVNWLIVKIGCVKYTAVKWGSIEGLSYYDNGTSYYAPAIPLLFVERID